MWLLSVCPCRWPPPQPQVAHGRPSGSGQRRPTRSAVRWRGREESRRMKKVTTSLQPQILFVSAKREDKDEPTITGWKLSRLHCLQCTDSVCISWFNAATFGSVGLYLCSTLVSGLYVEVQQEVGVGESSAIRAQLSAARWISLRVNMTTGQVIIWDLFITRESKPRLTSLILALYVYKYMLYVFPSLPQ